MRAPTLLTTFLPDAQTKLYLWQLCRICPGYDAAIWRYDNLGTPIMWSEYGNRKSPYGWEIDHITPLAKGGSDQIGNMQALNWQNNATKSDKKIF